EARNPGAGWRYTPRSGDSDTFVTGWAVMAIGAAMRAQLAQPVDAFEDANAWFHRMTGSGSPPKVAYTEDGQNKIFFPPGSERFAEHSTSTPIAVLASVSIGTRFPPASVFRGTLLAEEPTWTPGRKDFLYWFLASQVLVRTEPPKEY